MSYGTRIQHSNEPFELTLEEIEIHTPDGFRLDPQEVRLTISWAHGWPLIEWIDVLAKLGHKRKCVISIGPDHDWFEPTKTHLEMTEKNALQDSYREHVSAISEEEYA